MHRTEGNNNLLNLFANGPPGTVVEQEWLNAVQEEIAHVIEEAGVALKTAATETRDQLKVALDLLYKSKAAVDVPVGAIFSFPISTSPTGYLELNGASISKTTYASLYNFLKDGGATCIYGEAGGNFTLPDFRGRFPRGWDHGVGLDPDAATRTNRGDGTGGNVVGSKQADQLKTHTHTTPLRLAGGVSGLFAGGYDGGIGAGTGTVSATGGNETRSVNINVLWCIKY